MSSAITSDKLEQIKKLREELADLELEFLLEQNGWHRTFDSNQVGYWVHADFDGTRFYNLKSLRNFVRINSIYSKLFSALDELLTALPNADHYANSYDALKMFASDQAIIEIPVGNLKQLAKVIYGED